MSVIHEITSGVQDATRQIEANGGSIDRVISMIKTGIASIGIGVGFKELVGQVTNTRDEFQKLEIAFKTFLGSEEEADKLMKQMVHTAAITPFDLAGVADGAKNLLAFGVAAEDVNKTIISLGDIAAGLSQPLGDIIYLYGTTIVKPKMDTQDLMQMMGRGIPIAKELAKQFGVAENKVRDLISAGKVSGEAVKKAFESMTAEGSMFGGLMEAQSKSIGGQIANIEDSIDEMFNAIGKESEGVINITLEATSKIVENWKQVLLIVGEVAAAYGAQKGFLAFMSGYQSATSNLMYDEEIKQLQSLIPVKEEEAKSSIEQAVASGQLSEAKAAQIIALREEVQAQLEALEKKEAIAKAEEVSAIQAAEAAQNQLQEAEELVQSYAERLEAITKLGSAEEIETALSELETAEALRNEAANISNAASEEARAAATNAAAISEERETLATQINTAQTHSNSAATNILAIAKEKLALAVTKVNTVISANSILIVTVALIAMGKAVYDLATKESELEKSISKADEIANSNLNTMYSELNSLDEIKARLEKTKKGTDEWKNAKQDLISQFGKYNSNLDTEIEKANSLTDSYLNLTKAIRASNAARAIQKYDSESTLSEDIDSGLAEIQKALSGQLNKIDKDGNVVKLGMNPVKTKLSKATQDFILKEVNKAIYDKNYVLPKVVKGYLDQAYTPEIIGIGSGPYGVNTRSTKITPFYEKLRDRVEADDAAHNLIYERHSTSKEEVDKMLGISNQTTAESETKDKSYWEGKKKEAQSRLEALDNIAASGKEGAKIKAEIANYDKIINDSYSSKKKSGKSSGPTAEQIASKEENAAGKLADIIRKQAQERLRIEQDYEFERWQSRINLMNDGENKILAQQELNNKQELISLQRRKEQEIEAELQRQMAVFNAREEATAAGNKKYAKKIFRDSDISKREFDEIEKRYELLEIDLLSAQKKAEQERLNAAKESMNAYLKEFGSYQEKRLAIQEEYEKKISEAQNEGERMMLTAQRNKSLSDLDYEEWVDNGTIALAFGDISKISDKTVTQLISDMEKYRDKVIQTFDPEKIQKFEEALSGLRKAKSDNSFGIISSFIPDYFKERRALGNQMDSSSKNVNSLEEKRLEILQKIAKLQDLINVMGDNGYNTNVLSEQLLEANVELNENEKALNKSKNAFRLLQEQWDQLETPQAKFEALCGVISNITGLVSGLASQAAEMCDAMGASGLGNALGSLGEAMDSVGNVASGFAQGGLVGGIAAAAGEVMKWTTKLFQAGDNKKQKNIERLQEQIDALQKSYERVNKVAEDVFSIDASNLINQQNTLLKQQQVLIRQQMAEEQSKKNSDDDKIKEYKERLEEIDEILEDNKKKAKEAIIGEDVKSAINDFATQYAEAWGSGKNAAEKSMAAVKNIISSALSELVKKNIQPAATAFYDALAKAMEDGVLTDAELDNLDAIKRQIDALAASSEEQYKKIQERYKDLDELKEELTDISFDSVRDNFKSLLSDMESTTADFTDSFTDMLRNALLEGLMSEKYDLMLKEWYDEFAEAMNDRKLTDSERDALRQQYDSIVQMGLEDRDFINSIVGGGAYKQEATRGGWETMGQDQADELNGRFTALTELEAINNTLVSEGNMIAMQILDTLRSLSSLSMVTDGDNSTLREIRDMMFLSTGHLEDISKYTKQLITIREGIDRLNDMINKRL